jgi:CRP-like cAMP-binding protein
LEFAHKITANKILSRVTREDFGRLKLTYVDLPVRRQLEQRNRAIEHVYFIEHGLASLVVSAGAVHSTEVGIVGYEGMTGLAVVLGSDRAVYECFMQSEGHGWRIPADQLRLAMEQSPGLSRLLLRYVQTLVSQMAFTALANSRYKIEERLARWLLMAADRGQGNAIKLTHEFLAVMLGTRRPGVTTALKIFEKQGFIRSERATLIIENRQALEDAANGCYGAPEAEYKRLFGPN